MIKKQKIPKSINSNSIDTSICELTKSIKAKETLVFCGAGISFHSGLPTVDKFMPYILEKLGVTKDEKEMIINSKLPFEAFIETLVGGSDPSKIFDIFDLGEPNTNHILLAKLAKAGCITTICTTNFDQLIEKAFNANKLVRGVNYRVYYKEGDFDNIDWQENIIRLIKIHGSIEDRKNMAITIAQIASKILSGQRMGVINNLFCKGTHKCVLVLGYSCSEIFDISPQIEAIQENFKRVIFVDHKKDKCAVKNLSEKEENNPFQYFKKGKWIIYDTDKLIKAVSNFFFPEKKLIPPKSTINKNAWQKCVNAWYSEIEEKYNRGSKHNILGLIFSKIGESKIAKDYFVQALGIVKEIGDKKREGCCLGNLGGVYSNLGDYQKAIDYHEYALRIAREFGDKQREEDWLGNLGSNCGNLGDYNKARYYYAQALDIAGEIGDKNGEGRHLGNLGNVFNDLGEYQKAIDYHKKALGIAKEIGDKNGEGRHLGHLGSVYRNLGDHQKAIDYYAQALNIAKEIGDKREKELRLGNLGNAHQDLGEYKKAIYYHQQALSIAREIGDKNGEGRHLGNLGVAYYSLGNSQKAINFYEQALSIAKEIGDKRGEEWRLGHLGIAYSNLEDDQKAIYYHEQALSITKEIGDKRGEASWIGHIGSAFNNLGDYQKAIDYYNQSLSIAKKTQDKWGEGNWLSNLGAAYGNLEDFPKAIKYFEQALDIFRPMLGNSHPYVKRIEECLGEAKSQLE